LEKMVNRSPHRRGGPWAHGMTPTTRYKYEVTRKETREEKGATSTPLPSSPGPGSLRGRGVGRSGLERAFV
jgi:hypothetical protein